MKKGDVIHARTDADAHDICCTFSNMGYTAVISLTNSHDVIIVDDYGVLSKGSDSRKEETE